MYSVTRGEVLALLTQRSESDYAWQPPRGDVWARARLLDLGVTETLLVNVGTNINCSVLRAIALRLCLHDLLSFERGY